MVCPHIWDCGSKRSAQAAGRSCKQGSAAAACLLGAGVRPAASTSEASPTATCMKHFRGRSRSAFFFFAGNTVRARQGEMHVGTSSRQLFSRTAGLLALDGWRECAFLSLRRCNIYLLIYTSYAAVGGGVPLKCRCPILPVKSAWHRWDCSSQCGGVRNSAGNIDGPLLLRSTV